jgi:hypothetical protein
VRANVGNDMWNEIQKQNVKMADLEVQHNRDQETIQLLKEASARILPMNKNLNMKINRLHECTEDNITASK